MENKNLIRALYSSAAYHIRAFYSSTVKNISYRIPSFHSSTVENRNPIRALYSSAAYHIRAFYSSAVKNNCLSYSYIL